MYKAAVGRMSAFDPLRTLAAPKLSSSLDCFHAQAHLTTGPKINDVATVHTGPSVGNHDTGDCNPPSVEMRKFSS